MIKSLIGTQWICTDEESDNFGSVCTVLNGEIDPSYNGDNEIEIRYQDGTEEFIKLRRFQLRFEQIIKH